MTEYDTCGSDTTVASDPTDGTHDGGSSTTGGGAEPWSYDTDGDGRDDVVEWVFGDGTWQQLVDLDADGAADVLLIDTDGDGAADVQIHDNGDGTYTAAQDADGDGVYEAEGTFTRAELDAALPGVTELFDTALGGSGDPVDAPAGDDLVVEHDVDGDGVVDAVEWQFGDGTWQTVVDLDGDAQADVLLIDTDGDGLADVQIMENGDGTYTVLRDADGDSVFEDETTVGRADLDAALPGVTDLLDLDLGAGQPTGPTEPTEPTEPAEPVAQNGDTAVPLDTDGNGVVDTVAWSFGDGTWQELRDLDGDGNADVLVLDTDADDVGNVGIVDNGDGTYTVYADSNDDGAWDEETTTLTRAELDAALPGVPELLDTRVDGTMAPSGPGAEPTPDAPAEPVDNPLDGGDATGPVAYDTDDDGDADLLQWSYPDGTWQQVIDLDADADPDVVLVDTDGDATPNIAIWDNGDGTYTLAQDADADGEFEKERTMTRADLDEAIPGLTELLDVPLTGDVVGA
ncbi:hypothetical protein [Nakamurella deserti]|uniref:hypothetical protein n=1 Tax=Nakamurella deserti TaxID=2164074 RepID=UPI000DBE6F50|nr:hypothetical protein [Nakamurella deserti]